MHHFSRHKKQMSYLTRVLGDVRNADVKIRLRNGEVHSLDLTTSSLTDNNSDTCEADTNVTTNISDGDDDDDDNCDENIDEAKIEECVATPPTWPIKARPFVCRSKGGNIGLSVSPPHQTNPSYMVVNQRGMDEQARLTLINANTDRNVLMSLVTTASSEDKKNHPMPNIYVIGSDMPNHEWWDHTLVVLPHVNMVRAFLCYILVLPRGKKPLRISARSSFVEAVDAHLVFTKHSKSIYYYTYECTLNGIYKNDVSNRARAISGMSAKDDGTRELQLVCTDNNEHSSPPSYLISCEDKFDAPSSNEY